MIIVEQVQFITKNIKDVQINYNICPHVSNCRMKFNQ